MSEAPRVVTATKIIITIRCALGLIGGGWMLCQAIQFQSIMSDPMVDEVIRYQVIGDEVGILYALGGMTFVSAVIESAALIGLLRNAAWGRVWAVSVEIIALAGGLFFLFGRRIFHIDVILSVVVMVAVIVLLLHPTVKDWYEYRD
jgi:hypothetical protein